MIVAAAISVFARNGFAETSIQDVADEAGVVPTAVYYHFAGKDELFDVALDAVITELDEVVDAARPQGDPGSGLPQIITTVWDWIESRPDHARILYSHLPGATHQAQVLRRRFEDQHVERAYVYARRLDPDGLDRHSTPEQSRAATQLAVRTMISMLIAIHPMRLDGGPLSRRSPRKLLKAVEEVSQRMVSVD